MAGGSQVVAGDTQFCLVRYSVSTLVEQQRVAVDNIIQCPTRPVGAPDMITSVVFHVPKVHPSLIFQVHVAHNDA